MFFDDLYNEYGNYEVTASVRKSFAQEKADKITILVEANNKTEAEKKAKESLKSNYVSHSITDVKLIKKLTKPTQTAEKYYKTKSKKELSEEEKKAFETFMQLLLYFIGIPGLILTIILLLFFPW